MIKSSTARSLAQVEHRGEAETESREGPRSWVIGELMFGAKSFPSRTVHTGTPWILLRVGIVLGPADTTESETIPAVEKLRL